jgi:hypothetical protein
MSTALLIILHNLEPSRKTSYVMLWTSRHVRQDRLTMCGIILRSRLNISGNFKYHLLENLKSLPFYSTKSSCLMWSSELT